MNTLTISAHRPKGQTWQYAINGGDFADSAETVDALTGLGLSPYRIFRILAVARTTDGAYRLTTLGARS